MRNFIEEQTHKLSEMWNQTLENLLKSLGANESHVDRITLVEPEYQGLDSVSELYIVLDVNYPVGYMVMVEKQHVWSVYSIKLIKGTIDDGSINTRSNSNTTDVDDNAEN